MRKSVFAIAAPAAFFAVSAASAKNTPREVWQVTRSSDPITGTTSCVVAAFNQAAGMSFTRVGAPYPFIENSSVHGILIGVSSGGPYRLPTGDILWRVDDRPFRTLRAAENPRGVGVAAGAQGSSSMQQLVDEQMKLVAAMTATSTVASDATARAMLDEMLAGHGLVYRAAAATAAYDLPGGAGQEVGRVTKEGVKPYPQDDSLRAGLMACGVTSASAC